MHYYGYMGKVPGVSPVEGVVFTDDARRPHGLFLQKNPEFLSDLCENMGCPSVKKGLKYSLYMLSYFTT